MLHLQFTSSKFHVSQLILSFLTCDGSRFILSMHVLCKHIAIGTNLYTYNVHFTYGVLQQLHRCSFHAKLCTRKMPEMTMSWKIFKASSCCANSVFKHIYSWSTMWQHVVRRIQRKVPFFKFIDSLASVSHYFGLIYLCQVVVSVISR